VHGQKLGLPASYNPGFHSLHNIMHDRCRVRWFVGCDVIWTGLSNTHIQFKVGGCLWTVAVEVNEPLLRSFNDSNFRILLQSRALYSTETRVVGFPPSVRVAF